MQQNTGLRLVFLTGFLNVLFLSSHAQVAVSRSDSKVIIAGKIYYLHGIKAGQTLYSISQAYEVSEAEIIKENPGADKGLQVGQLLKIAVKENPEPVSVTEKSVPSDTSGLKHVVKKGETIYSISKYYDVPANELERINPAVTDHKISVGQVINIPRKNENTVPEDDFIYHTVKRKETIFGIARLYSISEELLMKYNPELTEKYPKSGQTLKIPRTIREIADAGLQVAAKKDTLQDFEAHGYDTAQIAGNYSIYLDSLPDIRNRSINVAYLLPFNYKPVEVLSPLTVPDKNKADITNPEQTINPDEQMLSSRNFLEFMEGSLLAIDSLKNEGVSINAFIYDTQKSPERTREIINSREFQKMDLIIGPFYSFDVEIVSEFSRINRIPMISPISWEAEPIENNPFFFQINPGYKTEFKRMAVYLSGFKGRNILFIHNSDSLGLIKYNYLKQELTDRFSLLAPGDSQKIREVVFDYTAMANLSQDLLVNLSPDIPNLIVIPETDEAFVCTVITQLYFQLKNYNISVIGMPHWNAFQNIDYLYFHKLSLTYLTPYYIRYDSANVKHFLMDFRNAFYAEPVTLTKKGGSYAFLGYDISYHFLKSINKYGKRFILHLNDNSGSELMNEFYLVPVGKSGGFENHSLMLVKFYENLDIIAEPYNPLDILKLKTTPVLPANAVPGE